MSARFDLITLEQLEKMHGVILVDCWYCNRHGFFFAHDLAGRFSPRRGVQSLAFKCARCGRYGRRRQLYRPLDPMTFR